MMPASNKGVGMNMGFPDVLMTPAGPAVVPVPYPNLALNSMAFPFSLIVKLCMLPALNLASRILTTFGHEPGVAHPLYKGSGGYTMGNPMIFIDMLPGIHLLCPTNGNNFNNPLGAVLVPSIVNVFFCSAAAPATGPDATIGDRLGRMMSREDIELLQKALGAASGSLGVSVAWMLGEGGQTPARRLEVEHVRRHMPGARMGLRPGDEIIGVSGVPASELTVEAVDRLLSPEPGSVPTLTVARPGVAEPVDLSADGECEPPRTRGTLVAPEVGYIELPVSSLDLPNRVRNEMRRLESRGMRALILDLRDSPGGDAEVFVRLADIFLERGTVITRMLDGDGDETVYRARQQDTSDIPLVLLVNGSTASAAELFAGCMRSHGRAVLVGQSTYGKSAIQALIPDPRGEGVLYATVASFALPDGEPLDQAGVLPDVEVVAEDPDLGLLPRLARLRGAGLFDGYVNRAWTKHGSFLRAQLDGDASAPRDYPDCGGILESPLVSGLPTETVGRELRRAIELRIAAHGVVCNLGDDLQLRRGVELARRLADRVGGT